MQADTHVLDMLPAYALGALDEAEAQHVRKHLAGCALCQSELSAYQSVVAELGFAVPQILPAPALRRRLMQRVQALKPGRVPPSQIASPGARQSLRLVWGVASLVVLFVVGTIALLAWQQINQPDLLRTAQGMRAIALHNTDAASHASGFVIISADGQNGVVVVDALPQPGPGRQYQIWLGRDGQNISGGTFTVDVSGYRGMRIAAPDSLLTYATVQVTIEPIEGSALPSGERVLGGSLHNF